MRETLWDKSRQTETLGKQHEMVCERLTLRAVSTFSFGIPVQVRCIHVSIPINFWHALTSSDVSSDVRPPAFLPTVKTPILDFEYRLAKLTM